MTDLIIAHSDWQAVARQGIDFLVQEDVASAMRRINRLQGRSATARDPDPIDHRRGYIGLTS